MKTQQERRSQKNLETVPSNGRDNLTTNNENYRNPNVMEVDDILQIISTTMARLKSFESRYRNAIST